MELLSNDPIERTTQILQCIINCCVRDIDWLSEEDKNNMQMHDWEHWAFNDKDIPYSAEVNGAAYNIYMSMLAINALRGHFISKYYDHMVLTLFNTPLHLK